MFINQCRVYGLITPDNLIGKLSQTFFEMELIRLKSFHTVCLAPTDMHTITLLSVSAFPPQTLTNARL